MIDLVRARCHGWAYKTAQAVRQVFAVRDIPTDEDLERVVEGLGVDFGEEDLPGGLVALLDNGVLLVTPGLSRAARRWAISHELGHHLGHSGDQTRLGNFWRWHQERQADVFAGFLLIGPRCLESSRSVYEIAECADVPLERLVQWLGWLATGPGKSAVNMLLAVVPLLCLDALNIINLGII